MHILLKDNVTSVKFVYNLTDGDYVSMGYIGTNSKNIDSSSGETQFQWIIIIFKHQKVKQYIGEFPIRKNENICQYAV